MNKIKKLLFEGEHPPSQLPDREDGRAFIFLTTFSINERRRKSEMIKKQRQQNWEGPPRRSKPSFHK